MHGFSDEERERIRERLVETGRELLLAFGPKKTNVSDITEPVGIAKSTFYLFFESKADLYLVIFQREMEEFGEQVRSELDGVNDPREELERLFRCYAEFSEENQLVQQTVIRGNYRDIFRSVSPEKLEELQREGMAEFLPFIEDLQARSTGPVAELDPSTVLGLMGGSIGLMVLHRDQFEQYDDGYYGTVQDALISSLARGLTSEENEDRCR